jgi:hypothetical protein
MRLEACDVQANEPDECAIRLELGCEQTETAIVEMTFDVVDQSIALFACERSRQELHHARIRIHRCKGFAIGVLPSTQK